jgi:hypothetical protein
LPQTSAGHVFISYSRQDKAVMDRIAELLQERGINVWVDNEDLFPGAPSWEEEIEKAIGGASAVIVLLSPDSKKSKWVRREVAFAEQSSKRIFPVLVRGGEKTSVPIRVFTSQRVDIRQNEEIGLRVLCEEITRFLTKPKTLEEPEGEELPDLAHETSEREEPKKNSHWASRHRVLVTVLVGASIVVLAFAIWFVAGRIKSSHVITPVEPTATAPAVIQPVSDISTPVCRPSGNQSPTITLKLEPVRVNVYGTAELTISVDDPENDPYEILAVTAEKGQFPNGKEEPYQYEAPGFPGKDIITVLVGDHGCRTKAEITINIE